MTIKSSGSLSFTEIATEKGFVGSVGLQLGVLSSTNINTLNPAAKVPANTSTASGNYPDAVAPHRVSEFYAYDHTYTPSTTTTTTVPGTTTTTTVPGTTTTTTVPGTTTTTTVPETTTTTTVPETTTTTTVPETTTTTTVPETTTTTTVPETTTTTTSGITYTAVEATAVTSITESQSCVSFNGDGPNTTIYVGSDGKYYSDTLGNVLTSSATEGYLLFEELPGCTPPYFYGTIFIINLSAGIPAQTYSCTDPTPLECP